jgi:hypothetical protein
MICCQWNNFELFCPFTAATRDVLASFFCLDLAHCRTQLIPKHLVTFMNRNPRMRTIYCSALTVMTVESMSYDRLHMQLCEERWKLMRAKIDFSVNRHLDNIKLNIAVVRGVSQFSLRNYTASHSGRHRDNTKPRKIWSVDLCRFATVAWCCICSTFRRQQPCCFFTSVIELFHV